MPSLAAKHAAYMDFTETRIEQRLDRMTDRKDIMSYVYSSSPLFAAWIDGGKGPPS